MTNLRICILALAAAATFGVGCGTERTDVSQGVEQINSEILAPQGANLDCPDEIEGGEGATFDCTMNATEGEASAPVEMKVVKEGEDLAVDIGDQQKFDEALATVSE